MNSKNSCGFLSIEQVKSKEIISRPARAGIPRIGKIARFYFYDKQAVRMQAIPSSTQGIKVAKTALNAGLNNTSTV